MKRLHVVSIFTLVLAAILLIIGVNGLVSSIPQWLENRVEQAENMIIDMPLPEGERSKPFFPTYRQAADAYIGEHNFDKFGDDAGRVERVLHIVNYEDMEVVFYMGDSEYQIILGVFLKNAGEAQATYRLAWFLTSTLMNIEQFENSFNFDLFQGETFYGKTTIVPILINGNYFYSGIWMDSNIYTLKIDGQSPDVIVKIAKYEGKDVYLWYYRNLQLDKKHIEIDLD